MNGNLLKKFEYSGEGIKRAVESGTWMVQILNFMPRIAPECIARMEKHLTTDEGFILTAGKAVLFTADGEAAPEEISGCVMQPKQFYLVPRYVWHAIALSEDASVMIVENSDVTPDNTPKCQLTEEQRQVILTASQSIDT